MQKVPVVRFWNKYFPTVLRSEIAILDMKYKDNRNVVLHSTTVCNVKNFLSYMVTMAIDKCKHRKLIVCPALFDKLYTSTFPTESDEVH